MDRNPPHTLDRVLSKAGLGSRKDAREWIRAGRVRVNGKVAVDAGQWVTTGRDKVTLDGKPVEAAGPAYVLLYKPKGYVTTYKDPERRPTVFDLLKDLGQFVGTVGRLDMDTTGLLLLTNDTAMADRLTDPEFKVEKEYTVKAGTLLDDSQLQRLRDGVVLDDGPTRPAIVTRLRDQGKHTFLTLTITEGRNRQVRRMLEAVGSHVLKLVRTRLGPLTLSGLEIGHYRLLEPQEVRTLKKITGIHAHPKPEGKLRVHQGDRPILGRSGGGGGPRDRARAVHRTGPARGRV